MTQTAELWWFLELGKSSQLVGVKHFQRRCSLCGAAFNLCCCPGIDLMDMAGDVLQPPGDDTARVSWNIRKIIRKYQETFSVIEKVGAVIAQTNEKLTVSLDNNKVLSLF